MAVAKRAEPVKRFIAMLWRDAEALESSMAALAALWGPIDLIGSDHPFDVTDYYAAEMGSGLHRRLLGFEPLFPPETLPAAKWFCVEIEQQTAVGHRRRLNLDVGYLDHHKLVLASLKPAGQKIYLGDGVYADLVARFRHGRYEPFEWTFPDFRDGRYDVELAELRRRYLRQLRDHRQQAGPGSEGTGP